MFDLFIDGLDTERCDEFMFRYINKAWHDDELGLMRSKWFDYRFLHPVIATYTYAKTFEIVWHRVCKINFGARTDYRGRPVRVFKSYDLSLIDRPSFSGLWRGRQHADALCMPYETYIEIAMTARLALWNRTEMPRPSHLYADLVMAKVVPGWEEHQAGRLLYSSHEEFKTHRFVGTKAQLDHHEWLFVQAGKRANPVPIMRRFYDEDLIPAEKVISRLGERAASHFPS